MNAANLKKSQRLQRVDKLLADGQTYTTRQIIHVADVCAISSLISELRDSPNNRVIHCWRVRDIWYYRRDLMAEKQRAAA